MDKLAQLSDYIDRNLQSPNITPTQRLFSQGTRSTLKRYFLVVIGLKIWARWRYQKFWDSQMMMVSCLTTCGAKPWETVIIMSLGSNETHKDLSCSGNRTLYGSGSATKNRFNEGLSFSPNYSSRGNTRCTIQLNCGRSAFKGIPKWDGVRWWRN